MIRKWRITLLFLTGVILIEVFYLAFLEFGQSNFNFFIGGRKTVVLTKEGFRPAELTISKGDTVRFFTRLGKPFWPASDIHPTHEIYSEFDSRRQIEPNKNWQSTFTRIGEWRYHDHLAPLFKGKIVVLDKIGEKKATKRDPLCKDIDESGREWCWNEILRGRLEKEGLEEAYDTFTELFLTEPVFAQNCHGYTHLLGEEAYEKFAQGEDFPVTPQVAYCSYGFFHGFIEAMMQREGSLDRAQEMCLSIDEKLKNQIATLGACYHGIGHGVTDASDPKTWGEPEVVIAPGLALCEKIGDSEYDVKLCGTGVFNALAIMYLDPKYQLSLDRNDPFWICRRQSKPYFKHACYDDFKTLIMDIEGNDFLRAARHIEKIEEDDYARDAMDNLATYYVYFILKDEGYTSAINLCHNLQERLRASCVSGLGAGFMTAGVPDREYMRALELCGSDLLNQEEKDTCLKRVVRLISLRYSPEKSKTICETIDEEYKDYCR